MERSLENQAKHTLHCDSGYFEKSAQEDVRGCRECAPDPFVLRGWDFNGAVTQDQANIGKTRLRTDFGFLPNSEVIPMFGQQLADQREARLVLWQISLGVFLDFHNVSMRAPSHQQIGCVAVSFPFVVVFQNEGLLLPNVGMRCGQQDPERAKFVERLRMPGAPAKK